MPSTFFFSNGTTVTSADTVITSFSHGARHSTLTSFQLGNEVTSIGNQTFQFCTLLTSATIPNSVTSMGGSTFWGCTNLASVTIGSGLTIIPNSAFALCTNLATVIINGNSLQVIDVGAFYGPNSLKEITIPNSLTSINASAFRDNANLIRVNFLGNAPSIGISAFDGTPVNLKIYRYSTKSGWSSTFGGKDVLLIDSPIHQGLQTFGFSNVSSGKFSIKKQNLGGGKMQITTKKRSDNLFTCPFEVDTSTCPGQDLTTSGWTKGLNTRIGKTTAPDGSNTAVEYESPGTSFTWVSQGYLQYWKPYTKYEFFIWAKSTLGTATNGQIMTVTKNSGGDRVALNASGNLTSTWQKFSITFTTGPTNLDNNSVAFFCADITAGVRFALWGAEMYRYG